MIKQKELQQLIKLISWNEKSAQTICSVLVKDVELAKKSRTLRAWENCLLFVGQVYRKDNFNVTLVAACVSNERRLMSELDKRSNKKETEARPKTRRGRKPKAEQ